MAVNFEKDLSDKWQTYFPQRNGIYPKFVDGKNFNAEVLHYMSKPYIAEHVCDRIDQFVQNHDYFAIDMCANVGGNTLEFLDRKNVVATMSFEINTERSVMLQRNILGYNFGDKAIVINAEVNSEANFEDYKDSVFFFDPPWLPTDLKNPGANYRDYYIRENMKLGDLTLEQWLEKLRDIGYIVIFRVPDNYKLNEVPGWTYVHENLGRGEMAKKEAKDGKLFICVNNRNIQGETMDKFGGSYIMGKLPMIVSKLSKPNPELTDRFKNFIGQCTALPDYKAKINDSCKMFVKYGFVDPEPSMENEVSLSSTDGLKSKNVPLSEQVVKIPGIPSPSGKYEAGSAEWNAEFQAYLSYILGVVFKDKDGNPRSDIINGVLDGKWFHLWIQAFSHESYQPDKTKNYEILEFIGDKVCNYTFTLIAYEHFKTAITPADITKFVHLYMSEDYQIYPGKELKFNEWFIKSNLFVTERKQAEDLFESFFGALDLTGDKYKPGYGMILCKKMMKFLCKNIVFNVDTAQNVKQLVGQRLSTIYGGNDQAHIDEIKSKGPGGINITQIVIKPATVKKLQNNKKMVRDDGIIGIGKSRLQADSRDEAYLEAEKTLNNLGITQEWAESKKSIRDLKSLEAINPLLIKQLKQKLNIEGYSTGDSYNYDFVYYPSAGDVTLYVLTGIKNDKTIKLGEGKNRDANKAKLQAIEDYVNKI